MLNKGPSSYQIFRELFSIELIILILALPLLAPLGVLLILQGGRGLYLGVFEFYWLAYEGLTARLVGAVGVGVGLFLLDLSWSLFERAW